MSDITVRRIRFAFPDDVDLEVLPGDTKGSWSTVAFSFTMPYLEPYLIRTVRSALARVDDSELAEDMRRFCAQESHHYRNHAEFNDRVRAKLSPAVAAEVRSIEAALDSDYRRFSTERSLRFNLAYAEGFEAMTGALAFALAEADPNAIEPVYRELSEWHLAEEIEHRTVAFDAYRTLVGSYPYRVLRGAWSQFHYLGFIHRFYVSLMRESGERARVPYVPRFARSAWRGYLRTFSRGYDPARLAVPPRVAAALARYAEPAERAS